MAITVKVTWRNPKKKAKTYRGENLQIQDGTAVLWTEPHEVVPGGVVDLAEGNVFPLDAIEEIEVLRI